MQSKKRVMLIALLNISFCAVHAAQKEEITISPLILSYFGLFEDDDKTNAVVSELRAQSPANQEVLIMDILLSAKEEIEKPGSGAICFGWQRPMLLNRTPILKAHLDDFCRQADVQRKARMQEDKKKKKSEEAERAIPISSLRMKINRTLEQYEARGRQVDQKLNDLQVISAALAELQKISPQDVEKSVKAIVTQVAPDIERLWKLYIRIKDADVAATHVKNVEQLESTVKAFVANSDTLAALTSRLTGARNDAEQQRATRMQEYEKKAQDQQRQAEQKRAEREKKAQEQQRETERKRAEQKRRGVAEARYEQLLKSGGTVLRNEFLTFKEAIMSDLKQVSSDDAFNEINQAVSAVRDAIEKSEFKRAHDSLVAGIAAMPQLQNRLQRAIDAAEQKPRWKHAIGDALKARFAPSQIEQANKELTTLRTHNEQEYNQMIELLTRVNQELSELQTANSDALKEAVIAAKTYGGMYGWRRESNAIMIQLQRISQEIGSKKWYKL